MRNMDINKLKRPVKYGKIPLILPHKKGDHMFTVLKYQVETHTLKCVELCPGGLLKSLLKVE